MKVTKKTRLLAAVPIVTRIVSDGSEGIVKGEEFHAEGTHLSFDVSAGDGIVARWTQGGSPKEILVMPTMTTSERMDFIAFEEFEDVPDGTEITFEFTLSGKIVVKSTTLLGE